MAFDYSSLKSTAERLIENFGKSATLIQPAEPDSDADPWDPVGDSKSTITLVETGYSLTNRNETLVQSGDKIWLVSTAGEDVELEDKIKLDSREYSLVDVQPLNPGGTTLLFEVHARS